MTPFARWTIAAAALAAPLAMAGSCAAQAAQTSTVDPDVLQRTLSFEGEAPASCIVAIPTLAPGSTNSQLSGATASSATVTIIELVNPTTLMAVASVVDLALPVTCNTAHKLTVHSQNAGLKPTPQPAAAPGFANEIDYTLTANWAGQNASFNTASAQDLQILVEDAAAGTANVTLNIPAGSVPLVAGNYSDDIVVEVAATS